jgi:hypothetical protein
MCNLSDTSYTGKEGVCECQWQPLSRRQIQKGAKYWQ